MPFMGRDWRSPGEAWIKTESLGWQRMKIIESHLTACHQNQQACSWPPSPTSQYKHGHHPSIMIDKCDETSNDNEPNTNQDGCDKVSKRNHSLSPIAYDVTDNQSRSSTSSPTSSCSSSSSLQRDNTNCCCCCSCSSDKQKLPSPSYHQQTTAEATTNWCQRHSSNGVMEPRLVQKTPPHCRISVRTKEVSMHNTISEAFYRLDFYNAIHDIRRFNYICKLLHLLVTQNLTSLSGCATRVLFTMLEQVAWEVSANKRNINVIRNLLADIKQTIQKYSCWGRPIGSSLLWRQHFETIERISQIVDEIELSPPKSDNYKVTFDKLPVEMIREILLRLNDYRDLVNSAQASPVMRTMIDNQCIWKKLCRYHFTDQQLKLAFESNKFNLFKKQPEQSSVQLRGIKYARTTSADGRSSYRSPVVLSGQKHGSSSFASNRPIAGQQTDQRQPRSEPTSSQTAATDSNNSTAPTNGETNDAKPGPKPSSSSYVTNAVRIFDKDRPSSTLSSTSSSSVSQNTARSGQSSPAKTNERHQPPASNDTSNGQALEIDWERVFHQLRKRFDLKEEYADCLLLCRHCRCLFWKSFGHPCIKNDEPTTKTATSATTVSSHCRCHGIHDASQTPDGAKSNNSSSNGNSDHHHHHNHHHQRNQHDESEKENGNNHCDSCNRSNQRATTTTSDQPASPMKDDDKDDALASRCRSIVASKAGPSEKLPAGPQISVALLTRNFDRQALGSAHESVTGSSENTSLATGGSTLDKQPAHSLVGATGRQQLDSESRPRQAGGVALVDGVVRHRQFDDLGAQLREHNFNRQRRQEQHWRPWQRPLGRDPASQGPDVSQDSGKLNSGANRSRAEELVPKHVTISPQAFLKFFSL